ncbi:MAG: hypothetical protein H6558_16670 [Lewinellaceae bacterium]|nr:hypothetical protein [Lewinellaceae bacterium]MCB9289220.1 hypothetical protein [Lewinellaceae bacterium]
MAGTKNYFDQILENQNKLYTTLLKYANTVAETAMPDKNAAEDAGKLLNEYYTRYSELAEKMVDKKNLEKYQKDFWNSFTADYTKSVELSMDLYKKTVDFYRNVWSANAFETQQERTKKLTELYQETMKAVYDTSTANAKVVQEYLN